MSRSPHITDATREPTCVCTSARRGERWPVLGLGRPLYFLGGQLHNAPRRVVRTKTGVVAER